MEVVGAEAMMMVDCMKSLTTNRFELSSLLKGFETLNPAQLGLSDDDELMMMIQDSYVFRKTGFASVNRCDPLVVGILDVNVFYLFLLMHETCLWKCLRKKSILVERFEANLIVIKEKKSV